MTITRRLPLPKIELPPAHLYLEDLEEIVGILGNGSVEPLASLEFAVEDQICDSIEDLRKIGGQTRRFEATVQWGKSFHYDRLYLYPRSRARVIPDGPIARQAGVMHQVHGVFLRRRHWLGRFRWLVISVLVLAFGVISYFSFRSPLFKKPVAGVMLIVGIMFLFPALMWVYDTSLQSALILKSYYERHGGWYERHRDQIILTAVTVPVTALITAIITMLVHNVLSTK